MRNFQKYETKRWLYLVTLPIMWILTIWVVFKKKVLGINPQINTFWFDGLSLSCRKIKEGAGSWRALDIIYNFQFGQHNGISGLVSDYWVGMMNAQAVRNRMQLVKQELIKIFREYSRKTQEIQLLSIASGSAQAVIETMAQARKEEIKIRAVFLDLDPTALEYSKKLAQRYGLSDKITFVKGNTNIVSLERATNGMRPHIIEMIGFLDYRPHVKAVRLVRRIYDLLASDGDLINQISVDLLRITAIYYRLAAFPTLPNSKMPEMYQNFLNRELITLFLGQLLSLKVKWVVNPFYAHSEKQEELALPSPTPAFPQTDKLCLTFIRRRKSEI